MYHDQDKVLELAKNIKNINFAQSFIFGGTRGIGKATATKELVNIILPKPNDIDLNLLWIESAGETITIDQVREIKKFLSYASHNNQQRIVVIDGADYLNHSAANALLKILEEPPNRSIIILIAHQPYKLLKTIRSRCTMIWFTTPTETHKIIEQYVSASNYELELIERLAKHIPGTALTLNKANGLDLYQKLLDSTINDKISDFCQEYFVGNNIEKWQVFAYLLQFFMEKLIKTAALKHKLGVICDNESTLIDKLTKTYSLQNLFFVFNIIQKYAINTIQFHLDQKTVAITLLNYLNPKGIK